VCISSPNISPVINNPAGGTFSATPSGLVLNTTTGQINVAASTPGDYIITFSGNGSCVTPENASFSIYTVAKSQFAYKPEYCKDEPNPLPQYTPGSSGGVFSATPTGLVFANTTTGQMDL